MADDVNTLQRLQGLMPIFAKAAVGDFSQDPEIPAEDDQVAEIYMGVKVMLEVIREKLTELENLNKQLKDKLQEQESTINSLVGRELRMVELKQEIEKMKSELDKYKEHPAN